MCTWWSCGSLHWSDHTAIWQHFWFSQGVTGEIFKRWKDVQNWELNRPADSTYWEHSCPSTLLPRCCYLPMFGNTFLICLQFRYEPEIQHRIRWLITNLRCFSGFNSNHCNNVLTELTTGQRGNGIYPHETGMHITTAGPPAVGCDHTVLEGAFSPYSTTSASPPIF